MFSPGYAHHWEQDQSKWPAPVESEDSTKSINQGVLMGEPLKMDAFEWENLLEWMIWGYAHL